MTNHRVSILPPLLAILFLGQAWGQTACDLDNNGTTNVIDVSRAVNMALGTQPCTASVEGAQVCSVITVQRVVNAALGQPCVTYNSATGSYKVSLSWKASPTPGILGYNLYRRTSPTGTATKLNSAPFPDLFYTDTTVQLGQTYYYYTTATVSAGESGPSNQVSAVIPGS